MQKFDRNYQLLVSQTDVNLSQLIIAQRSKELTVIVTYCHIYDADSITYISTSNFHVKLFILFKSDVVHNVNVNRLRLVIINSYRHIADRSEIFAIKSIVS